MVETQINKSDALRQFDGITLINKIRSISSYDVIRSFKRVFFCKKSVTPAHSTRLQRVCL